MESDILFLGISPTIVYKNNNSIKYVSDSAQTSYLIQARKSYLLIRNLMRNGTIKKRNVAKLLIKKKKL